MMPVTASTRSKSGVLQSDNWQSLPAFDGLVSPAIIRGVIHPTRLMIDIEPGAVGCEITLHLLGFDPGHDHTEEVPTPFGLGPPRRQLTAAARAASDQVAAWIADYRDRPGYRHRVVLPRPQHVHGWTRSLVPSSAHAGYLFLAGDSQSLNQRIADAGICPVDLH